VFLSYPAVETVPTVTLNNGVEMPQLAVAPMDIDASGTLIGTILGTGLTHMFTAEDYYNSEGIKAGLEGRPRSSYFLTSMTSPCIHSASKPRRNVSDPEACYNLTMSEFQGQLDALGVDAVDLMMLHGPSRPFGFQGPCGHPELNLAQWRAYSDMYKAGKARAIGVSNYCQSCLEPLIADESTPTPATDQLQFHDGMGQDPEALVSYHDAHGIALQAYSPLASGALVSNDVAVAAGTAHGKSGAQAALRWITQRGGSFVTSASNTKHLADDADVFDWDLSDDEMAAFDALTCDTNPELCTQHSGTPSWGCTE
jgi:2,5-diketo-D-gluconate reductase A